MLDQEILNQLKSVFSSLDKKIFLNIKKSTHPKRVELLTMLKEVASINANIEVKEVINESINPEFSIEIDNRESGVKFLGIPGGHEFTSFIVAILNAGGLGKLPDNFIIKRIKNLKGPIKIKTYISLSCENCPEVVQALNLMAILNQNMEHTMIDGEFVQDEISSLNIQGVPSVMVGDVLLSSGKIQLIDLLQKLETHFGTNDVKNDQTLDLGTFDSVVIGGGPAGVSAAIYTVRKGIKIAIVCERIGGQVQDTKGIENLISNVYTEGPKLASDLRAHLENYPVAIYEHRRVKRIVDGEFKKIELESGEFLLTRAIIVATGAKWRELNIPGEKEYIGRGVAFCPHCDGPYYKGKKVAVVGGGNSGVEAAIDLASIVREVILFEFLDTLKADKVLVDKLKSLPNVSIITNAKTEEIIGDSNKVVGMKYTNRTNNELMSIDLDGVFVQIGLLPNSQIVKELVETTKHGEIVIDVKGRTSVSGIYAAGDVTIVPYKQIVIAMGEGAKAGLALFEELAMKK